MESIPKSSGIVKVFGLHSKNFGKKNCIMTQLHKAEIVQQHIDRQKTIYLAQHSKED